MRMLVSWLLVLAVLPRVEDPWPDAIGLEFPVEAAGVGGVIATVLFARAARARREKATFHGGLWGFYIGSLLYVLSLLKQLSSFI